MEANKHTVLLYEDQEYADLIIGRYFLNGLEKGESCIFFTADAPGEVEKRLAAGGIDVELFKRRNLLRIFYIEESDADKTDIIATLCRIREDSTRGMKPPFRFVGRTITDTATIDGMKFGLRVEQTGHEHFEEFNCSQMCYYNVSGMEQSQRDEWITGLLKNHHNVVWASQPENAVAFETSLLEREQ
jgi:hypothetical protein